MSTSVGRGFCDDPMSTESALANHEALGELIAAIREFSLSLTESIQAHVSTEIASDAEMSVMIAIRLDGPTRPRTLARIIAMTSGGITNLLDRLEAGGLIRRTDGVEGDQRSVRVELTPAGTAAVKEYAGAYAHGFAAATPIIDRWRTLFAGLGHDVATMKPWGSGGRRNDLIRIRKSEQLGRLVGATVTSVTGADDPAPWHTFHLLWLAHHHGGVRPRQISAATHLSSASTTGLVDRLVARDLVRRATGETPDRRAVVVTATADGRELLDAVLDAVEPLLAQIADVLFPT